MSTAPSGGGVSPTAPARKPEKPPSTFTVTCNLVSQFLKDRKGAALGDCLGISTASGKAAGFRTTPTTMSLLPGVDLSGDESGERGNEKPERNANEVSDLDLFPRRTGFFVTSATENNAGGDTHERERRQLTIFYAGKVLVFDNFPAEKAQELMQLASKGSKGNTDAKTDRFATPAIPSDGQTSALQPKTGLPSTSGCVPVAADHPARLSQAGGSEMPIARRQSLHRFLEKRKDRIQATAPYQWDGAPAAAPVAKPEEGMKWLGLNPERRK